MSNCSIEQDENLVRQFQRTPGTPTKVVHQTPRRSSRKRALFQPSSPVNNSMEYDDLGLMSPLSTSSTDTFLSENSPCFSVNGKLSTPPKTPESNLETRMQGRLQPRKIEITSTLYNNWRLNTPKSHKSPCTPRRSRKSAICESDDKENSSSDILKDLTTPPRSSRKTYVSEKHTVTDSETESSEKIRDSTPRRSRSNLAKSPAAKRGLFPIPAELFYGPAPPAPKARSELLIDTLGSKFDNNKRRRSLSLESISSSRSFVSGACQQKKKKKLCNVTYVKPRGSKRGRQKGPYAGVWHGVKKPKKMKMSKNPIKKPLVSPNSRIAKMVDPERTNASQVKPKQLFQEKPRRRVSAKKGTQSGQKSEIIDSFPHNLIKRKRLPTTHPAVDSDGIAESRVPDPTKKFLKYGAPRQATFTLNENVKLNYSSGVMKLQSPKKRRKLYSGKNEIFFDTFDDDDKNDEVKENIENILSKLDDDVETPPSSKKEVPLRKISEEQLVQILNSPRTKISIVDGSPSKVLTEIQNETGNKLLANMSSLAIDESNAHPIDGKLVKSDVSLEKTGTILSEVRKILSSGDSEVDTYPLSEEETDTGKDTKEKYFSLFYKQNWNVLTSPKEDAAKGSAKKKSIKIPDDQYLLDAGQKSVGIVTCGKCGVMYQAGDFADEATHKNFHEHLPELRFQGWANERIVGRYLDGRVIMIVSADPKPWWQKVSKIVDIVDQELGFPEGSVNALYYKTVYFYISDKAKQIVGCLIAEECKEAYKMFPPLEGVDVDSCSKDPSPCKVGISRIWTALNHRRRGVAKRMIDCMRRTFFFGEIVPMDYVAFSVPSPSGKLLAQNVTGKLDFLVYGFV